MNSVFLDWSCKSFGKATKTITIRILANYVFSKNDFSVRLEDYLKRSQKVKIKLTLEFEGYHFCQSNNELQSVRTIY